MTSTLLASQLIRAVDEADSAQTLLDAVRDLADARLEEAIPTLIAALGYNNPGAAVAAVDGLIALGPVSVQPILTLLDTYNYSARAWGIRALAGIGDPRGLDLLLDAAQTDFAMSVRRAAARGLGIVRWTELPIAQLPSAQTAAYQVLIEVCDDPEWIVRYAAVTGLEGLAIASMAAQPTLGDRIVAQLQHMAQNDQTSGIRARSALALRTVHPHAATEAQGQDLSQERAIALDWQQTLERIYHRKAQERPLCEGDPRRFRHWVTPFAQPVGA